MRTNDTNNNKMQTPFCSSHLYILTDCEFTISWGPEPSSVWSPPEKREEGRPAGSCWVSQMTSSSWCCISCRCLEQRGGQWSPVNVGGQHAGLLTGSEFPGVCRVEVRCIDLPGKDGLCRGHLLHVTVPDQSHSGSCAPPGAQVHAGSGLRQRGATTVLLLHPFSGGRGVHGGRLVEESIVGADGVELLPGVCDRAGPLEVELGARGPPHLCSVASQGADEGGLLLSVGGPLQPRGLRRETRRLTFCCVRHRGGSSAIATEEDSRVGGWIPWGWR